MLCKCNTVFNESVRLRCPSCGLFVPEGPTQTLISLTPKDAAILLRVARYMARGQSVSPKADEVLVMQRLAERLEISS